MGGRLAPREHGANPYANPVTGLHLIVDMDTLELVEIEDDGAIDEPQPMGEYVAGLVPGLTVRDDLRPLEVSQPQGASFTLDGNLLRWGRWSLRVGFNGREGLVLHTVGWDEGDRVRSVAHRLSFAEMVVPYRDPTTDHQRRTAFDVGEWGMGFMTTALELGCDCLGEIAYLDASLHDSQGEPYDIPNAICIHEEDAGGAVEARRRGGGRGGPARQRRLVVSFHATVANYEYLVYWRFHEDGSIECEVRATGIMVTTHFAGEQPPYGTLVDERTYAPTTSTSSSRGWTSTPTARRTPSWRASPRRCRSGPTTRMGWRSCSGRRRCGPSPRVAQDPDWATQRSWKVVNERSRNGLGSRSATSSCRATRSRRCSTPTSPVLQRARSRAHAVGDALRARGALAVRRVRDPARRTRGLPAWTAAEPPDRGHRRGALVRLRHPPHDPAGGLARDAGGHGVVLAQAGRLLRPQPGVGRGAASGASRGGGVGRGGGGGGGEGGGERDG